ncbi:tetratricopeptide repeat protein [Psychroserpens sp. MEBiC05023]
MKSKLLVITLLLSLSSLAQPNCYIYPKGSGERKACELSYKAITYPQGSKMSQELFDEAIAIGPKFAWAYYEKSVPYFKRGFLLEGLSILNKAIELDPKEYLCYRAYWFWQYKNYNRCISDLETYYNLPKAYQQFTPGGDKDMKIILGLAYAKNGNYKKGISIILNTINNANSADDIGLTDYHSLGMLYVLDQQYDKAITTLNKQLSLNKDIAETYYFLGLALKGQSNLIEVKKQFNKARSKYAEINRFKNINSGFEVFISDVENEIKSLNSI